MSRCHVFVITSVTDLTSSVLLEALSHGLPVIAPDLFGFSNVITGHCGIKIPVCSQQQFVADLAQAINAIEADEMLRQKMAEGALQRAKDFTWAQKAQTIDGIYSQVINQ